MATEFLPGELRGQRSLTGYTPWGLLLDVIQSKTVIMDVGACLRPAGLVRDRQTTRTRRTGERRMRPTEGDLSKNTIVRGHAQLRLWAHLENAFRVR